MKKKCSHCDAKASSFVLCCPWRGERFSIWCSNRPVLVLSIVAVVLALVSLVVYGAILFYASRTSLSGSIWSSIGFQLYFVVLVIIALGISGKDYRDEERSIPKLVIYWLVSAGSLAAACVSTPSFTPAAVVAFFGLALLMAAIVKLRNIQQQE